MEFLGLYLFLSGIKSENKKVAALKVISGGMILSFAITSWGGSQFFISSNRIIYFSTTFC